MRYSPPSYSLLVRSYVCSWIWLSILGSMDLGFIGFSLLRSEISCGRGFLQFLVVWEVFWNSLESKASSHLKCIACIVMFTWFQALCYVYDDHDFPKLNGVSCSKSWFLAFQKYRNCCWILRKWSGVKEGSKQCIYALHSRPNTRLTGFLHPTTGTGRLCKRLFYGRPYRQP